MTCHYVLLYTLREIPPTITQHKITLVRVISLPFSMMVEWRVEFGNGRHEGFWGHFDTMMLMFWYEVLQLILECRNNNQMMKLNTLVNNSLSILFSNFLSKFFWRRLEVTISVYLKAGPYVPKLTSFNSRLLFNLDCILLLLLKFFMQTHNYLFFRFHDNITSRVRNTIAITVTLHTCLILDVF